MPRPSPAHAKRCHSDAVPSDFWTPEAKHPESVLSHRSCPGASLRMSPAFPPIEAESGCRPESRDGISDLPPVELTARCRFRPLRGVSPENDLGRGGLLSEKQRGGTPFNPSNRHSFSGSELSTPYNTKKTGQKWSVFVCSFGSFQSVTRHNHLCVRVVH